MPRFCRSNRSSSKAHAAKLSPEQYNISVDGLGQISTGSYDRSIGTTIPLSDAQKSGLRCARDGSMTRAVIIHLLNTAARNLVFSILY